LSDIKTLANKYKKDSAKFKTKDHCKFLYSFLKIYTVIKQDTKLEGNFATQLAAYDKYTPILIKSLSAVFGDTKNFPEDIIALSNAYLELVFCISFLLISSKPALEVTYLSRNLKEIY